MLFIFFWINFLCVLLVFIVNNLYLYFIVVIIVRLNFLVYLNQENLNCNLYFIVQEFCRLVLATLIFYHFLDGVFLIFMVKAGIPPFWHWILVLGKDLIRDSLVFFASVLKVPFILILVQLISTKWLWIIATGMLLSTLRMISLSSELLMFITSRAGTRGWVLLLRTDSRMRSGFMLFYFGLFWILISKREHTLFRISPFIVLILISFPLSVVFLFKIIISSINLLFVLFILLSTTFRLQVYLKTLWSSFIFNFSVNKNNYKIILKTLLVLLSSLWFII